MSNISASRKIEHERSAVEAEAPESASARPMVYETSAGGVVLRHIRGCWQVALIEPNIINADTITRRAKARPEGTVFALPKGGVDEGETPEQSADREVFEETGVRGRCLFRLMTIRYLYVRSWGGRERVSKSVSFYLFLYSSGRLGQIRPDMRDEVRKAFWFPLDKAHRKLTYRGEREVLKMAQAIVREHPELLTPPAPEHHLTGPEVPRPVAQQRTASKTVFTPRPSGGRPGAGQSRPVQNRPPASSQRGQNQQRGQQRPGQRPGQPSSQRSGQTSTGQRPGQAPSKPHRRRGPES